MILSCKKQSINCSDKEGRAVFYELLSQNFAEVYSDNSKRENKDFNFNLEFENVKNSFFKEAIIMEGIRPTEIKKDLKKCFCEAQVTYSIPSSIELELKNKISKYYNLKIDKITESSIYKNVSYTFQITEDDKLYSETDDINLLKKDFLDYAFYVNLVNNVNKKNEPIKLVKNKNYRYVTGSEDCSYTFDFIVSNNGKEISGTYTQDCIDDLGLGEVKFNGNIDNGIVYGNTEKKEFFEMEFYGDVMNYTLKKQILDNGEEINFSEYNQMEYQLIN